MRIMDAPNTFQVFDWLWTSGQLSREDIQRLPDEGIQTVINLAAPDSVGALAGEADWITQLGMNYFQIPIQWNSPRVEQFDVFAALLQSCQGQKVWIHCIKNMRVSAYMYLYRSLILKEAEEKALHPMQEIWTPQETWKTHLENIQSRYHDSKTK